MEPFQILTEENTMRAWNTISFFKAVNLLFLGREVFVTEKFCIKVIGSLASQSQEKNISDSKASYKFFRAVKTASK